LYSVVHPELCQGSFFEAMSGVVASWSVALPLAVEPREEEGAMFPAGRASDPCSCSILQLSNFMEVT